MALIKQITRFEPTINGPLHVGHIYLVLVNEAEAHVRGGRFIVRFEDNQPEWVWRIPRSETVQFMEGAKIDLDWLGIQVDEYQSQAEMQPMFQKCLEALSEFRGYKLISQDRLTFDQQPELTYTNIVPYPYAPYLTRERVIFDFLASVNLLIRGEDLVSEFSLYAYFCEMFGIQRPRMVFVPRMKMIDGGELLPIAVSKTTGKGKICDYRKAEMEPSELLERLRQACLIDPAGPWLLTNLKAEPRWTL
jgi:glutamyl/glutaminyl-tRNA synthetase